MRILSDETCPGEAEDGEDKYLRHIFSWPRLLCFVGSKSKEQFYWGSFQTRTYDHKQQR